VASTTCHSVLCVQHQPSCHAMNTRSTCTDENLAGTTCSDLWVCTGDKGDNFESVQPIGSGRSTW
jgi:hypothetical protein